MRRARLTNNEADGIRTRNLRIDSPEEDTKNTALAADGALEGASDDDALSTGSDFAQVTAAWPDLPDHIKAAILALVRASGEAK